MSDEQTRCAKCGVLILTLTARETGGVCMVCARGTREEFEKRRQRTRDFEAQMAEYRKSPEHQFWRALVQRVHTEGIASVSLPEQFHYAVCVLQGEVFNGGFHQYFSNSSGDLYEIAERALEALGAETPLDILRQAKALVFGEEPVPNWEARNDRLDALEDDADFQAKLSALDKALNEEDGRLSARVNQDAVKNGLYLR
jgi:hypothetical protein